MKYKQIYVEQWDNPTKRLDASESAQLGCEIKKGKRNQINLSV